MKKIYHRFFYISKCEKVSEKALKIRIVFSVFVMVICCIAFCSATFAWFTSTKKVETFPVMAANYELSILAENQQVGNIEAGGTKEYCRQTSGATKIILGINGTGKIGYCKIEVGGKTVIVQTNENKSSYTINIEGGNIGDKICFTVDWGVYEGNDTIYEDNSTIVVSTTSQENQASTYSNTEATPQPAEGNVSSDTGEDTSPANTPPVNTEAPATGTGETANPETLSTPSESESSVDNTTTSEEMTGQELAEDVETQAQQNSETESIAVTE